MLQEYTYKGSYTYIYTDQDSYEPLAQVFCNNQDEAQYLAYFHNDQVGIPREMTDIHGNLLWYGEYTAWGRLKKDERVYKDAHQPFRLQNQYYDEETGLHYNLMRYYEPEVGRFVNQDPIGLWGGDNLYQFAPNIQNWVDFLGLRRSYAGKQERIRALATDKSQPRFVRGWVQNEIRRVETRKNLGKTTKLSLRLPPGFDLAHWRGYESKKGFSYTFTSLLTRILHRLQHKKDNGGRRQPLRASRKCGGKSEQEIKDSRK